MIFRSRIVGMAVVAGALVALALLVVGGGAYWAARQEPEFYARALAADPAVARQSSDELLDQVALLTSAARQSGHWEATFTAEQINGWLAVDVRENHPEFLPPEFQDPRVELVGDRATIACRYDDGALASVLTLDVHLYLLAPNEVALQFGAARAGLLPLPLGKIIAELEGAVADGDWRVRWLQSSGEPVIAAQLAFVGEDGAPLVVEELAIRDGLLVVAGRTGVTPEHVAEDQPAGQLKIHR